MVGLWKWSLWFGRNIALFCWMIICYRPFQICRFELQFLCHEANNIFDRYRTLFDGPIYVSPRFHQLKNTGTTSSMASSARHASCDGWLNFCSEKINSHTIFNCFSENLNHCRDNNHSTYSWRLWVRSGNRIRCVYFCYVAQSLSMWGSRLNRIIEDYCQGSLFSICLFFHPRHAELIFPGAYQDRRTEKSPGSTSGLKRGEKRRTQWDWTPATRLW